MVPALTSASVHRGNIELVEHERLCLFLQIVGDLGRHGVRQTAKRQ